jgi:hypothetical protein
MLLRESPGRLNHLTEVIRTLELRSLVAKMFLKDHQNSWIEPQEMRSRGDLCQESRLGALSNNSWKAAGSC